MVDDLIGIEAVYAWMAIYGRNPANDPIFDKFLEEYENDLTYRHKIASLVYASKENSKWKRWFKEIRKIRKEKKQA